MPFKQIFNILFTEFVCKYDSECNKKGKCNTKTGKCECDTKWFSDDCTPVCKLPFKNTDK